MTGNLKNLHGIIAYIILTLGLDSKVKPNRSNSKADRDEDYFNIGNYPRI